MSDQALLLSKVEFARHIKRDPAFVTRAIQSGKLVGGALVGEGRTARINVAEALRQLGLKLDLSQQLAQAAPILPLPPAPSAAAATPRGNAAVEPPAGAITAAPAGEGADVFADEKVEALRLKNAQMRQALERGAREDAVAAGQLVDVHAVRQALGRQVQPLVAIFDEIPAAIAKPLSEQFSVPYPELLIAVKQAVRRQRFAWAEKIEAMARGEVQA